MAINKTVGKAVEKKVSEPIKEQVKPASKPVVSRRRQVFKLTLQIIACGLIIGFVILATLAKTHPYFVFDVVITHAIQSIKLAGFDNLMVLISQLGNPIPGTLTIIIFALLLFLAKQKKDAILLLVSTLGLTGIGLFFKTFIARPRPDSNIIIQLGHYSRPDSFPSGHVLHFLGLYGFLFYLLYVGYQRTLLGRILMILCIILIILIGFSRIYLGAHWFSDTLGSYLIGTAWLYFMTILHKRFSRKAE